MKKVLFFDIDGTLVDFHGVMPESTRRALKKARENGHNIVICSGRSKYQVYPELLTYADGLIGCAGAYVSSGNEIIYEEYVPKSVLEKIKRMFSNDIGEAAGMTDTGLVMNKRCQDIILQQFQLMGWQKDLYDLIVGDVVLTEDICSVGGIRKVLYFESGFNAEQISDALRGFCDVTESSFEKDESNCGEISYAGINKSLGMEKYLAHFGATREDSIAFGDGPNDLDMIQYAQIGVCMGNGRKKLKEIADFVTKDIEENGIEYAMKQLGLI